MKIKILFIALIITNFSFSQEFNTKLFEQLTIVKPSNLDDFMLNGYNFIKRKEEKNTKSYYKVYNNSFDTSIHISITSPPNKKNVLDIYIGKKYSLEAVKDDIVKNDFLYNGKGKYGGIIYTKKDLLFLVNDEENEGGGFQILLLINE